MTKITMFSVSCTQTFPIMNHADQIGCLIVIHRVLLAFRESKERSVGRRVAALLTPSATSIWAASTATAKWLLLTVGANNYCVIVSWQVGEKGTRGATGEEGRPGQPGHEGLTGPMGARGLEGEIGIPGSPGPRGLPVSDNQKAMTGLNMAVLFDLSLCY